DDGTAEYARLERQRAETRSHVAACRAELQRLDESAHLYRTYAEGPLPGHRELLRLFREYPRVIDGGREERIVDPKIARRKYETAVMFKVRWDTTGGYC